MSEPAATPNRLLLLAENVCDETATSKDLAELDDMLLADDTLPSRFVNYCRLHAALRLEMHAQRATQRLHRQIEDDAAFISPNVLAPWDGCQPEGPSFGLFSTTLHRALACFPEHTLIAYLLATVITGLGLLISALTYVSQPEHVVSQSQKHTEKNQEAGGGLPSVIVGRITGLADCVFQGPGTSGSNTTHHPFLATHSSVRLGDSFVLQSGLLEITYDTGAKVLLQGPVTYEVDSAASGFLAIGKLTACVERSTEYRVPSTEYRLANPDESNPQSLIPNPSPITRHSPLATSHPLPPRPSPLFTISTPSAVVTDLGTEFGVSVDLKGATTSHVFRGTVVVKRVGSPESDGVVLRENQSAQTDAATSSNQTVRRVQINAGKFARRIARRLLTPVFNTGIGLQVAKPDPHWEIVAISGQPDFKSQPAWVVPPHKFWLAGNPKVSQWLSLVGDGSAVPIEKTYTFRTKFDLSGFRADTALLNGWFWADDKVTAIRLNGHPIPVPPQRANEFTLFHTFNTKQGFVEGVNVLELDVANLMSSAKRPTNRMGLRVELKCTAESGGDPPDAASAFDKTQ